MMISPMSHIMEKTRRRKMGTVEITMLIEFLRTLLILEKHLTTDLLLDIS